MAQQATLTDGGFETRETADDVFGDVECDLADIRGTITYEGRLYSREAAEENVPVNVLTGEKSTEISPVEQAKAFAERNTRDGGHQYVAVPNSTESMIETNSKPYLATVFYNSKIVCGKAVGRDEYGLPEHEYNGSVRERGYRAVAGSDRYEVRLENADYETGDVTITVEEIESE